MCSDASVIFADAAVRVTEGENVEVCLELVDVPAEGLACSVSVELSAMPDTSGKPGEYLSQRQS